jgi:hypothetical protein
VCDHVGRDALVDEDVAAARGGPVSEIEKQGLIVAKRAAARAGGEDPKLVFRA